MKGKRVWLVRLVGWMKGRSVIGFWSFFLLFDYHGLGFFVTYAVGNRCESLLDSNGFFKKMMIELSHSLVWMAERSRVVVYYECAKVCL